MRMQLVTKHIKVLFTALLLVLVCFVSSAFADKQRTYPLAPDLNDVNNYYLAQALAERSAYDANDIYILLNGLTSTYSNVKYFRVYDDYNYTKQVQILNELKAISGANTAYDLHDLILDIWRAVGGNTSGDILTLIRNLSTNLDNQLGYDYLGQEYYYQGEIAWYTKEAIENNGYKLDTLNTNISDIEILQWSIVSALDSVYAAVDKNYTWSSLNSYAVGTSLNWNSNYISQNTTGTSFKITVNNFNSYYNNLPSLIRIFVPIYPPYYNSRSDIYHLNSIYRKEGNIATTEVVYSKEDIFYEATNNGCYIYIFDLNRNYSTVFLEITTDVDCTYDVSIPFEMKYIPFDNQKYQEIKTAFYTQKNSKSSDYLKRLADVYASDDVIAAKNAQQEYEDESIADFTGNGTGAAQKTDKNGLKSTSSALKSGLDSGGSVNNSLGVFNSNNSIWSWFTNDVKNSLDTTVPTRDNSDPIVDFITNNTREILDGLYNGESYSERR